MGDKQNHRLEKDNSPPAEDPQPADQNGRNGSPPKSYYYDDSTGYEIYEEQGEEDDEESG